MMSTEEKVRLVPTEPGVYLFKDSDSRILYVGKAASLRERVRSYFQTTDDLKTQRLMREVSDFEYIVTRTERDALILEATLIKKHQPYYNIRLKDDKRYPYIKLTNEPFPKLELARRAARDRAQYFGPYTSGNTVGEMLKLLQKTFRLRTCNLQIEDRRPVRKRPCLDHYIGLCDAPCVGAISPEDYDKLVRSASLFLRGRSDELVAELRDRMERASERLEFECAARLRDQITVLERLLAGQRETVARPMERDLIAYALVSHTACVQVFFMRGGKLVGRESFFLDAPLESSGAAILTAFVKQYYEKIAQIPKEIFVPCALDEPEAIRRWLSERRGGPVHLKAIERGPQRRLLDLVTHNAELALRERATHTSEHTEEKALRELQDMLQLQNVPRRIEAYDISNFQGREAVGSMIVFRDGLAKKSEYRRFRIHTVPGVDDFSMIAEIVKRRLERARAGDERFLPLPDLILIDGGRGQLSAARAVMHALNIEKIHTVALAKEYEHIFLEGRAQPVVLPRESPALQLLQRMRDEAHRFALSYHRTLRTRAFLQSALDAISGIGPKRRQQLFERFGSLQGLKRAKLVELQEVLPVATARRLYRALRVQSQKSDKSLFDRTDGSPKRHH
jgi:excinuclease ABC subunit C